MFVTPELDVLKRYNVPTPRYTSYPTALSFEDIEAESFWPTIEAEDTSGPVALYFHLPFCRSLCWYCACSKVITRNQQRSAEYLEQLFAEIELKRSVIGDRPVVSIHLGGGTPTFFTAEELRRLFEFLDLAFNLDPECEIALEIDPRELSEAQVQMFADVGVNRVSLGVQDHDPKVQKLIHRDQPLEMTQNVVRQLRAVGIDAINFDLIYGLPGQTEASFTRTIADVIELAPTRLAVYSYAHVPWVAPAQKLLERTTSIPRPDQKLALFQLAARMFGDAGFRFIGMDHFARPEDSLSLAFDEGSLYRNFMGYTTHAGADIHAFGVTAISQTTDTYFQNSRDLEPWAEAIEAGRVPLHRGIRLTHEDRVRRHVIMAIMCRARVDFRQLELETGIESFSQMFAAEIDGLKQFEADGFVELSEDSLVVSARGRFFVRNIASAFDAYRDQAEGFSRAV